MSDVAKQLDALERRFGKGQTLTRQEFSLVLDHGVPCWLIVARKFGKGEVPERSDRLIRALTDLHRKVRPLLEGTNGR